MRTQLDRTHKIAFSRVVSDLIEADFIVQQSELEAFEDVREKYNISDNMLAEARQWTFADAIGTLSELKDEHKAEIISELERVSLSDGTCVPLEAIQLMAVRLALLRGHTVFSVAPSPQSTSSGQKSFPGEGRHPSGKEDDGCIQDYNLCGITINRMDVIFVNNSDRDETSLMGEQNYQIISDCLSKAGYNFVYVPYIARDFASLGEDYLDKVIKYMIPDICDDERHVIAGNLISINTKRFCRDLLYKKIGIDLTNIEPSFLIKINESYVAQTHNTTRSLRIPYSNYLLLPCSDDVIAGINEFVGEYMQMLNCPMMVESRPSTRRFLYTGFHKTLFDLIAYVEEKQEYRLVIDRSGYKINVRFVSKDGRDEISRVLDDRESALYYMIALKTRDDGTGLNWYGLPAQRERQIREYHNIYTGSGQNDKDYKDNVHISKIKRKISVLGHKMANVGAFLPVNDRGVNYSYYRINARREDIIIIE